MRTERSRATERRSAGEEDEEDTAVRNTIYKNFIIKDTDF